MGFQKICTNFGKCVLADNHENFALENKDISCCPLCDKKLSEVGNMPSVEELYVAPVNNVYVAPVNNLYVAPADNLYVAPVDNLYVAPAVDIPVPPSEDRYIAAREDRYVAPKEDTYVAPREIRVEALDNVSPAPSKKVNSILSDLVFSSVLIVFIVIAIGRDWIKVPQKADAAEMRMIHQNAILRLAGSDIVGDRLGPAMAKAFLQSQGATNLQIIPGSTPEEKIIMGVLPGDSIPSSIEITANGSTAAFAAMADETCDVGIVSRKIKPEEASELATVGNMSSASSEHILALDGIAVIVNPSNRINELRKEEIRRIFTGDITDWSQVGSSHGAIKIYARDDLSGVFDEFNSVLLNGKPLASSSRRFEDSNALSDEVSSDPNGIGFVSLPYVHNTKSIAVSERGTAALKPTHLTVATEDYPLSRRLYLYTPATARNKYMQMFVEFALSRQGQELVADNGYISQNIQPTAQVVSEAAPEEYRLLTEGAERLSLDLRFSVGKSEQDSKTQTDLDRIASMIADQEGAGSRILLFGFADNAGTSDESLALSLSQAKAVESQLIQRGIKPTVVRGYGSVLPVASNDSSEGRAMNRRVEIWLKKK
ncbi:MAG: phosphate ABC transporter substrate-binding/OmpA family protein [Terracidiphilus sp.]|jgi:phosphate transport system substrate-binding protein